VLLTDLLPMMDKVSPETRSRIMASIKSKDTRPEMIIRRALHSLGFRYRLHVKYLPGCPDLVLPKYIWKQESFNPIAPLLFQII